MKATGIVRRIDDLGRVVIPKEIRRTLRIREGDPLEIYTDSDGEVIFKKYSPVGELSNFAAQYAEVLAKISGLPTLISDRDHIVAAAGVSKREYLERRITPVIEEFMETRRSFAAHAGDMGDIQPVEGMERGRGNYVPDYRRGRRHRQRYHALRRQQERPKRGGNQAYAVGGRVPRQADGRISSASMKNPFLPERVLFCLFFIARYQNNPA